MTTQNTTNREANRELVLKLLGADLGEHPKNASELALEFVVEQVNAITFFEKLREVSKELLEKVLSALPGVSVHKVQLAPVEKEGNDTKNEGTTTLIVSPLDSERKNYEDKSSEITLHPAINFSVTLNSKVAVGDLLIELLGENDTLLLISDYGDIIDFTKSAPEFNKVTLFPYSKGLELADDLKAMIVCARLVKKARDAGLDLSEDASSWAENQSEAIRQLNETEFDLLTKLRDDAVLSSYCVFYINTLGRLCANYYNARDPYSWVFASFPS